MSGYLQRLVVNAQARNTAIRPVLGSLFSPGVNQAPAQNFEEIQEVLVSRPRPASHFPAPEQSAVPGANSGSEAGVRPEHSKAPFPATSERAGYSHSASHADSSFAPLVAQAPATEPPSAKRNVLARAPESDATSDRVEIISRNALEFPSEPREPEFEREAASVTRRRREISSEAVPPETVLEDLLKEEKVRPEQPHKQGFKGAPDEPRPLESFRHTAADFVPPPAFVEPRPSSSAPKMVTSTSHRNKALPKQEPDEIQIHIGRIEIAAILPPPVSPPTPRVRKSIKLDEYLRRGGGSSS